MELRARSAHDYVMRLHFGLVLTAILSAQDPWRALVDRAESLERLGDFPAEKGLLTEALRSQGSQPDALPAGTLLLSLARAHFYLGEMDDADLRYRQAISALDKPGDQALLTFARALANYASLLDLRGSLQEAERKRVRALEILTQHLPPKHPEILTLRWGMALSHLARRDFRQAELICRNVIEDWRSEGIPAHATLADAWSVLGFALLKTGRGTEAAQAFQESVSIIESLLGPSHPQLLDPLLGLGKSLEASRDLDRAEQVLARAQALASAALPPSHPTLVAVLSEHANVLRALGHRTEAKSLEKLARARGRAHAAEQHTVSLAELANTRN